MRWLAASPWFPRAQQQEHKIGATEKPDASPETLDITQCTGELFAQQVLQSLPGLEPRNSLSPCRGLKGAHTHTYTHTHRQQLREGVCPAS